MATTLAHVVGIGLISPGQRAQIESCKLSDLVEETEAKKFRFTYQETTGTTRLHLIDVNGDYVAIKLSPKVKLKATQELRMFFELLTQFVVYYGVVTIKNAKGEEEERAWFTLSTEANLEETPEFDIADAMPKAEKKGKAQRIP